MKLIGKMGNYISLGVGLAFLLTLFFSLKWIGVLTLQAAFAFYVMGGAYLGRDKWFETFRVKRVWLVGMGLGIIAFLSRSPTPLLLFALYLLFREEEINSSEFIQVINICFFILVALCLYYYLNFPSTDKHRLIPIPRFHFLSLSPAFLDVFAGAVLLSNVLYFKKNTVCILAIVLSGITLFLCSSLSPIFAIILAILLLPVTRASSFISVMLSVFLGAPALLKSGLGFGGVFGTINHLSSNRLKLWYSAVDHYFSQPLHEILFGGFKEYPAIPIIDTGRFTDHYHNLLIANLYTSGMVGTIVLMVLFFIGLPQRTDAKLLALYLFATGLTHGGNISIYKPFLLMLLMVVLSARLVSSRDTERSAVVTFSSLEGSPAV